MIDAVSVENFKPTLKRLLTVSTVADVAQLHPLIVCPSLLTYINDPVSATKNLMGS